MIVWELLVWRLPTYHGEFTSRLYSSEGKAWKAAVLEMGATEPQAIFVRPLTVDPK